MVELYDQKFLAEELTADLLNCSQEDYAKLCKIEASMDRLITAYTKKKDRNT